MTATTAMLGLGAVATVVTARRGEPLAISGTLGYFAVMEALQLWGYGVRDACGTPSNEAVTLLSYIHISLQPIVINAFAMAIAPRRIPARTQRRVVLVAALATALIAARLLPFESLGTCVPGTSMCSERLCLTSGEWHIAWELPLNGILAPTGRFLGGWLQFPEYFLAVFLLPLCYGAWRFVLFHLAVGPLVAYNLTSNPNEMPAIWCLFSIGILLIGLSPAIRHRVFAAHRSDPAPG
ncbi:DUF5765 domain-containing protein [Roseibacterium sp. SDUM158017]|uniref:DUF5765 domain-containing protein n=1 Tax=Roseicyclus salinarum TaxID=3036773 RepID=UPI002414FB14|nr:DUF5765 domain-containing protein [Roseibacterium sp. SDUM158017]MDG4649460.1 DUF5765 domain-containing protein [Roseibacterium sp. SDUM158017]